MSKIRTESESELEVRKSECVAQIETKLTAAELNREKEILKKLEAAKKYVMYLLLSMHVCVTLEYLFWSFLCWFVCMFVLS